MLELNGEPLAPGQGLLLEHHVGEGVRAWVTFRGDRVMRLRPGDRVVHLGVLVHVEPVPHRPAADEAVHA